MHTERGTFLQLSFDFEATASTQTPLHTSQSNVVHIKFGKRIPSNLNKFEEDFAVLQRVLSNAKKLKW